ncbi:MAG: DUF4097 family beta strand repeat-containing protein [Bacilli bacterium]|nr:DUF4097 family beta strand repeat-containing protein [Bacilli bacterium]
MNTDKKGLYFTFLIFIIGVLICIGVLIASEFDFSKFSTEQNIEKKEIDLIIGDTDQFDFIIDNASINFTESPDDQLHVTYYESNRVKYEVSTTSSSIEMTQVNSLKWYDYIGINFYDTSIDVKIPTSYTKILNISTDNCVMDFKDLYNLESIIANSKNATVDFDNVTVQKDIYCKTTNSTIDINYVNCINLTVITTNSEIELENINLTGTLISETSSGVVHLEDINADVVNIKNNNGTISFDDLISPNITLKALNGVISGNIIGSKVNYKIISSATNGINNLPEYKDDGTKYLEVTTSNGMINITFN